MVWWDDTYKLLGKQRLDAAVHKGKASSQSGLWTAHRTDLGADWQVSPGDARDLHEGLTSGAHWVPGWVRPHAMLLLRSACLSQLRATPQFPPTSQLLRFRAAPGNQKAAIGLPLQVGVEAGL